MPLTVFSIRGIPESRVEGLKQAVEEAGEHVPNPHEAWIAPIREGRGFCIRITGPRGFFWAAEFRGDESTAEVRDGIRHALER